MANFLSDHECPLSYTLSLVGGKWKCLILYILSRNEVLRYGELKKELSSITHRILSQQLKELEVEEMISRKEYQQSPPKVEYSMTAKGKSLLPILHLMNEWGKENRIS